MTNRTLKQQRGGGSRGGQALQPRNHCSEGRAAPTPCAPIAAGTPGVRSPAGSLRGCGKDACSVGTGPEEAPTAGPPSPQAQRSRSLGAGAVALRQRLEVHGERLFFSLRGALPVGASQDVEHDHAKADQQQAQHVGQDALRLERAVLGPAGSGWEGEATHGVTVRPLVICPGARKMPPATPAPPPHLERKPLCG